MDPPVRIGAYQVRDELGSREFVRVYRAFDPSVGRMVAVTVLMDRSKEGLMRFQDWAAVSGNLHHENIATVYEYGVYKGLPFLATEYLEGKDLRQIIRDRTPLDLLEKCRIMGDVAKGLAYAHESGFVHGHLTPASIVVPGEGPAKILDLGLDPGPEAAGLEYLAPARLGGAPADARSDIFAFGVIFYELLTGRYPVEAPDLGALGPPALEAIISRALSKDSQSRYASFEELSFDLDAVREELRRQRAAEAVEHVDRQQLDAASLPVRQELQVHLQKRSLQARISELLRSAEGYLRERRFSEAIESLESASRLDLDRADLRKRLEETRALQDRYRAASALMAEARQYRGKDLDAAFQSVMAALRQDPQNPEAAELLNAIHSELQRKERIEAAVRRAKNLLLKGGLAEAEAMLAALGADAAVSEAQALAEEIRREMMERQGRGRLDSGMAAASELLRAGRIEDAVARLDALQAEFPDRAAVTALLKHVKMQLEAGRRQDAVSSAAESVRALLDSGRYQEAEAALRQASQMYPHDPKLLSLFAQVEGRLSAGARRDAAPALDHVHFTITAPSSLEPGGSFELYFWVHLNRQRRAVIERAMLALGSGKPEEMVVKSEGPVALARGTVVSARISIDGLAVDPCEKSVLWSGEAGCASFIIPVPAGAPQRPYHGVVSIRVNRCEVARMDFLLRVAGRPGRVPAKLKRHATAFASYASEDRDAVMARLQGMQKVAPWLKVFMDVVDLRSGDRWEQQLHEAIRDSDVFYLFWCSHARASEWVDREWRYAYQHRGLEFIDPVPLEPSRNAPPPDELKMKHFNDLWTELNAKAHRG